MNALLSISYCLAIGLGVVLLVKFPRVFGVLATGFFAFAGYTNADRGDYSNAVLALVYALVFGGLPVTVKPRPQAERGQAP